MSSIEDPAKLKVVELRAELSARGLDTKGVKAILVKRLKGALESEYDKELPNTTVTDTSTEDCNLSAEENDPLAEGASPVEEIIIPPRSPTPPPASKPPKVVTAHSKPTKIIAPGTSTEEARSVVSVPVIQEPAAAVSSVPVVEKAVPIAEVSTPQVDIQPTPCVKVKEVKEVDGEEGTSVGEDVGQRTVEAESIEEGSSSNDRMEVDNVPEPTVKADDSSEDVKANGDKSDDAPVVKKRERKNRWAESDSAPTDVTPITDDNIMDAAKDTEAPSVPLVPTDDGATAAASAKRKRSRSPVQQQQFQKKSRSPIREDNPTQDENSVQLNWYDSDLNLLIDKKTFTKARPVTDGAFSYIWAGVRATHGINTNRKVYFEVKVSQKLRTEDIFAQVDRDRRDKERRDRNHQSRYHKSSSSDNRRTTSTSSANSKDNKDKEKDKNKEKDKEKEKRTATSYSDNVDKDKDKDGEGKGKEEDRGDQGDDVEKMDVDVNKATITIESEDSNSIVSGKEEKEDEQDKSKETAEDRTNDETLQNNGTDEDSKSASDTPQAPTEDTKPLDDKSLAEDKSHSDKAKVESTKMEEKKEKDKELEIPDKAVDPPGHQLRVGWSLGSSNLQLGEDTFSFGYDSSGCFVADNCVKEYGVAFSVGDTVRSYLSIEDDTITITYAVNGALQPTAIVVPRTDLPADFAFYPHILSRNFDFICNFTGIELLSDQCIKSKESSSYRSSCRDEKERENKINEKDKKVEENEKEDVDKEKIEPTTVPGEDEDVDMKEEGKETEGDKTDEEKVRDDIKDDEKVDGDNKDDEKKLDEDDKDDREEVIEIKDEVKKIVHPEGFEDFLPMSDVENKTTGVRILPNRSACKVLMMIGLPGCGKTTWALKHIQDNPDANYVIINAQSLLARMTINCKCFKSIIEKRWRDLLDRLERSMLSLCEIAAMRRRNFILDQHNTTPFMQRRKMRPFKGYQREAVVIVADSEEFERRQKQQIEEDQFGKDAVNLLEIKGGMSVPRPGDWLESTTYVELDEEKSREQVVKYVAEGRAAGYGSYYQGQHGRGDGSQYGQHGGHQGSGGYHQQRGYSGGRLDHRGGGGGGHYNRHDGGGYGGAGGGGGGGGYGGGNQRHGGGRRDFHSGSSGYSPRGGGGGGGGAPERYNSKPRFDNNQRGGGGGRYPPAGGGSGGWNNQRGGSWNNRQQDRRDNRQQPYNAAAAGGGAGGGGGVGSGGREWRGGGAVAGSGGGGRDSRGGGRDGARRGGNESGGSYTRGSSGGGRSGGYGNVNWSSGGGQQQQASSGAAATGGGSWGGSWGTQQGQGQWNQSQWKGYGNSASYGQGGYSSYYNYYGQYGQGWGSQGTNSGTGVGSGSSASTSPSSAAVAAAAAAAVSNTNPAAVAAYAQMTPAQQQAAWAQYAQQYAARSNAAGK